MLMVQKFFRKERNLVDIIVRRVTRYSSRGEDTD